MPDIKYVGLADAQHFDKSDFTRHGVEDQGAVTFTADKPVQSLSDAAWAQLQESHGEVLVLAPADETAAPEVKDDDNTDTNKGESPAAGSTAESVAKAEKAAKRN